MPVSVLFAYLLAATTAWSAYTNKNGACTGAIPSDIS